MDQVRVFLSAFMSAVSNCSLYSKEHASVDEFVRKAMTVLEELFRDSEALEIMVIDEDLVVNKNLIRYAGVQGVNLIKRFRRKGVSRIDLLQGIELKEIKQLVAELLEPDMGLGNYPHIRTGAIDIKTGGEKTADDFRLENAGKFSLEQTELVRDVFHNVSHYKKLDTTGLDEMVLRFIAAFKKEANILKLLCPVKTVSEYTYVHATNVAILSMFQSETLGVRDELKHDIGIAALLHDVGKVFISPDILEKKGKLDEQEWNEIRLHTVFGAKYLAKTDGLSRLAPIVAYEHHLRFDGKGYPNLRSGVRKQHPCSQIVSISDYFDALRSRRPYRSEQEYEEILFLMKKEPEGMFNPALLDNFIKSMFKVLSE